MFNHRSNESTISIVNSRRPHGAAREHLRSKPSSLKRKYCGRTLAVTSRSSSSYSANVGQHMRARSAVKYNQRRLTHADDRARRTKRARVRDTRSSRAAGRRG
ncbi:hypothetical protein EVAR_2444_1 [Eumeta japonica]|uniref:Uncharacterized protein n=1 Tax=Eumeta variegata TaxID=151549 RepID=A0A4C1SNJ2_EUMVA|nr:hypothetical protein EVAR_2444_1 [Eumeta japonica]